VSSRKAIPQSSLPQRHATYECRVSRYKLPPTAITHPSWATRRQHFRSWSYWTPSRQPTAYIPSIWSWQPPLWRAWSAMYMKMDETRPFKTLVTIYQTTRSQIPENSNLHSHRHENLNLTIPTFLWNQKIHSRANISSPLPRVTHQHLSCLFL
jgi:hypothetical protein